MLWTFFHVFSFCFLFVFVAFSHFNCIAIKTSLLIYVLHTNYDVHIFHVILHSFDCSVVNFCSGPTNKNDFIQHLCIAAQQKSQLLTNELGVCSHSANHNNHVNHLISVTKSQRLEWEQQLMARCWWHCRILEYSPFCRRCGWNETRHCVVSKSMLSWWCCHYFCIFVWQFFNFRFHLRVPPKHRTLLNRRIEQERKREYQSTQSAEYWMKHTMDDVENPSIVIKC